MEAAGGIASIIQILDATAKLINYVKDVRSAEKQITTVQTEIEVIRYVLYALKISVDENPETFRVTSTILGANDGILDEFSSFAVCFKEKLEAKPGRKLLWPFNKSHIQQDLEKIQRYKAVLVCALSNDSVLLTKKIKDGVDIIKRGVEKINHSVDDISTALEQQKKHDTLEWLSPTRRIDFSQQQAALTAIRSKNSGRWLIESKPFGLWLDGNQDSIILKGGGGMGKTMLASTAIEHLTTLTAIRPERNAIAYAFGNWAHADKFSAQNLLASLLKQLLSVKDGQLPVTLEELRSSKTYPTYPQLSRLLQLEVRRFSKTFIVIDALDELNDDTQDKLLKTITELQTSVPIKLMVTSRDPYRILQYKTSATELDIRATKEDLELWMDDYLRALPPGCFVAKSSPETHQNIKATLSRAADGMFLLAKLCMSSISKVSNLKKLKNALKSIASGSYSLDEAYNDTMERLKTQHGGMEAESIILLSFVAHTSIDLTVRELEHAMAVEVDEPSFDTDNISDLREAINSCGGLIAIDPEDDKVVLAHYTLKEYFDRTKETHFPDSNAMITERCLTYLSDAKLKGSCQSYESYEARLTSFPFLEYAAQNWGYHASQGEFQKTLSANILDFLRNPSNVACSGQAMLQSEDHWWHRHGSIEPQVSLGISGLHICAWFGLLFTATQLIEDQVDVNILDHNQRGPLWYAVYNRRKETVKLLLERGAEISTDVPMLPVFEEAVRSSDPEIVKILGSFHNYSVDCCSDMLNLAAQNPHCGADMAKLVLDSYPSVPIEEIYDDFILSSVSNHLCGKSIVSMLISRGWKIPLDLSIIRVLSGNMSTGADILKCLLSQDNVNVDLDASIFEVAASGLASDVMEALLDHPPGFQFNVDVLPLTAERNEEMFLTVLKRHPHFEITQQILERLVQSTALRSAAMEALFNHAPPGTLKIDDSAVVSAIRATYNVSHLIQWLLSHYENPQNKFPEKILVAAVGSNDAIRILNIIKSFEPTFRVTPRMLLVAVLDPRMYTTSEGELLQWLLQHDPACRIDESSMIEIFQTNRITGIDLGMLLSHQPLRLTYPLVSACANSRDIKILELLLRPGGDISDPDIIDVITNAVLKEGLSRDFIAKVLGYIPKQHMRITSASLQTAAGNMYTTDAIKWVLDYDSTLEITSAIFEAAACGKFSFQKLEALEKRSSGVKMTDQLLIASAMCRDTKTLQWALDRSDVEHITHRVLECAAGVWRKDNVSPMKLIATYNPSVAITEEALTQTCQMASWDIKPLEWILAVYPQLSVSEIPMAALLRCGKSDEVVKIIKEHLPKLNITHKLLATAAKNRYTNDAWELILTFDIRGLLSESILTAIAGSNNAASKLDFLLRMHPTAVSASDTVLRAASESPHGPGALQWFVWFLGPRNKNQTLGFQSELAAIETTKIQAAGILGALPLDAMTWYLNRDPSPVITQNMLVAAAHQPWGGDVLALLLKRDPIFTISKELMEAVCFNWEFGEDQCRLILNHHKNTRISDDILYAVLSNIKIHIYRLIRDHNDDIYFQ